MRKTFRTNLVCFRHEILQQHPTSSTADTTRAAKAVFILNAIKPIWPSPAGEILSVSVLLPVSACLKQNIHSFIFFGVSSLHGTHKVNSAGRMTQVFFVFFSHICVISQPVNMICAKEPRVSNVTVLFVCANGREREGEVEGEKERARERCQVYPPPYRPINPTWEWSTLSRGSQIYLYVCTCACVGVLCRVCVHVCV